MCIKSSPIVSLLIVVVATCLCPIAEGQISGRQPDTTLLDYKMVNVEECHHLSLQFTNIDAQTVIALYAKLSGLELVVDSHAKAIHTPLSVQAYELTQGQQISLVERDLKEQAGIVITRFDDKRAR
jgi:hypothetical protein